MSIKQRIHIKLPGYFARQLVAAVGPVARELRDLFKFLRKGKVDLRFFGISVLMSFALGFMQLYIFSLLFPLIDGIIKEDFTPVRAMRGLSLIVARFPNAFHSSHSLFLLMVGWIYLAMIIKNITSYLSGLSMVYQGRSAARQIRMLVFDRILTFGKQFFDHTSSAGLNQTVVSSSSWIESQLGTLHGLLTQLLSMASFLYLMFRMSWQLSLAVLLILPLVNALTGHLTAKIRRASLSLSDSKDNLFLRTADVIAGITLVKGYGKETLEREHFSRISRDELTASMKLQKLNLLVEPTQDVCQTTGLLLVAGALSWIGRSSGIPASETFGILYLTLKLVPTFNAVTYFRNSIANLAGPIIQFENLMNDQDKHILPDGQEEFAGLHSSIQLRDLSFAYRPGTPVIRGLNLTLKKGQVTALVGHSGAGKTTIANLLLRFYDCPADSIFFDGRDIRSFRLESLRDRTAFVSQDSVFFNTTLRANLCYALADSVSDEKLREILRVARLDDLVKRLPKGLDSVIGERGTQLSGGEKQRVSIARALLKQAEILILDEPTSALDSSTESLISSAMQDLTRGRTVVVIAHRLATIQNADQIAVIEHGQLREQGSFEELVEHGQLFRRFWMDQGFGSLRRATNAPPPSERPAKALEN